MQSRRSPLEHRSPRYPRIPSWAVVGRLGGAESSLSGIGFHPTNFPRTTSWVTASAELAPFNIQVQLINPGGYLTGFNETEAESSSHWMDDRTNYIKRDIVKTFFDQILSPDDNRMDPQLMADAMVQIIPDDTGLFRNVVPQATEELARQIQRELWDARIDLPSSR